MCGIAGSVNYNNSAQQIAKLTHRGPDGFGEWRQDNLFLIHRRLAIVDLTEAGHQPMSYKSLVISYNGEIYNYLELRTDLEKLGYQFLSGSDTEVILKSIDAWGLETALNKFNGMWAFALFDLQKRHLILCRDRIGKKPLYYLKERNVFCFASEVKGIPDELIGCRNDASLVRFVSLGYVPFENSYFKNVYKVPPAHFLRLDLDTMEIVTKSFWSRSEVKNNSLDFPTAVKHTETLLESAINYRLIADLEVGAFLSGGIDSSLIAALASRQSNRRIKTFSIGFDVKEFDESPYALQVASHLKTDHTAYHFTIKDMLDVVVDMDYYYDEPFGDSSALPSMILSKLTKQKVTVALSGDGGDELFAGYSRYFFTKKYLALLKKNPTWFRNIFSKILSASGKDKGVKMAFPVHYPTFENVYSILYTAVKPWELNKIFKPDFLVGAFEKSEISLYDLLDWDRKHFETGDDVVDFAMTLDFYRNLPDDMLTKVDRATMRYSLEARCPILDYRIIDFANSIPTQVKLNNGVPKAVLKDILYKFVPKPIFNRPKAGFAVPLKHWFRNDLKRPLAEKISSLDPTVFQKSYIETLQNEHINNNKNYQALFWNLMRIK